MNAKDLLEKKIANLKKELAKKDLCIGILTEHIGFEKATEVMRENNYDLRVLAIEQGRSMNLEQSENFKKEMEKQGLIKEENA